MSRVKNAHLLNGVHPILVQLVYTVGRSMPLQVIEGLRSKERQQRLYASGASKTLDSYHLLQATGWGHAVDIAPLIDGPLNWKDLHEFWFMGGAVRMVSKMWHIPVVWGRNWDDDDSYTDQSFDDFPHIQIAKNFKYEGSGFDD